MEILRLLDAVQGIARNGLTYATDPRDKVRYSRLLEIVCEYYALEVNIPADEVQKRLSAELGQITPKVGAVAAIFRQDGEILLMQRSDDQQRCLPSGWVEPYESPEEATKREVKEETGLDVDLVCLADVITRRPNSEFGPHTVVSVVYLCEVTGGEMRVS